MSRYGWKRSRTRGGESGAAAVEFALVLLPLMTLLLGMVQYGWYFFTAQSASSAARETARQLTVGNCQGNNAEAYAQRQANVSSLTLEYGAPDAANPLAISGTTNDLPPVGDPVRVIVRADGMIIGFVPMPNDGAVVRVVDARVDDDDASWTC